MNPADKLLAKTPQSDDTWHCPWFRLIEFFAAFGMIFGLWAYIAHGADLGIFALGLGGSSAAFSLGHRNIGGGTC